MKLAGKILLTLFLILLIFFTLPLKLFDHLIRYTDGERGRDA